MSIRPNTLKTIPRNYIIDLYVSEVLKIGKGSIEEIMQDHPTKIKSTGSNKIIIRPITPDDTRAWHNFILKCSKHTIYSRYNHAVEFSSADIKKFCEVDGDDEIAYVAELDTYGMKQIIGEVRLFRFEDNPECAEFSIMVADKWQSRGIGTALTETILTFAKKIGIKKIVAYTESDNHKMLKIFNKLGFDEREKLDQTVDLEKLLF